MTAAPITSEKVSGFSLILRKYAGGCPGELLLLDIHYPLAKRFKKTPVFYYTHGGGWASGPKEPGRDIKPLFDELLKQGVACVSVQYRLVKMWRGQDPVRIRDCIVDCQDGLRFLKQHAEEPHTL